MMKKMMITEKQPKPSSFWRLGRCRGKERKCGAAAAKKWDEVDGDDEGDDDDDEDEGHGDDDDDEDEGDGDGNDEVDGDEEEVIDHWYFSRGLL